MQNQTEIQRLKKLSNSELFGLAKHEVREESNATLRVLYVLREIQRRRAFAEKEYPSLFEFCVDYLGYKKSAAYRRITALKALTDLPEVEEKIQIGSLSLMTLSQAQTHFEHKRRQHSPLSKLEKLGLLESLENKSTRQADELFLTISPKEIPREKLRPINAETFELSLALPKRVCEKIKILKMYMGAEKAGVETIEALERGLDCAIKEYEKKFIKSEQKCELKFENTERKKIVDSGPILTDGDKPTRDSGVQYDLVQYSGVQDVGVQNSCAQSKVPALGISPGSGHIPIHIKRQVWKNSDGSCSHADPRTGQRCTSRFKLEIDHIIPRALGGTNDINNLRLVCRAHNQWAAIQQLGFEKMEPFLN